MTRLPTTLLTLALHGAVWAGPVASEQADAAAAGSGPGMAAHASVSAASAVGQGLPDLGHAGAAAPAGSALVLDILKEADAAAAGHEAARQARREAAGAASAAASGERPPVPKRDDDPWGLRDIGKTALGWAKSAIPWLRNEDDEARKDVDLKHAEWSASSLGHEGPRGATRTSETARHAQPDAEVIYGEVQRAPQARTENNLLRDIVDVLRLVLGHPMTWLVVSLFVVGGILVKRIDRRPTK